MGKRAAMTPEQIAVRYKRKVCLGCEQEFIGYGRQLRCGPCNDRHRAGKTQDQQEKARARSAVQIAVAAGRLIRRTCEHVDWRNRVCGQPGTHAHHEDYSQPLEVVWLCPSHHASRHYELRFATVPPLKFSRPGLPAEDRDW